MINSLPIYLHHLCSTTGDAVTCTPRKICAASSPSHLTNFFTMDIHRCRFVDYTPHTITALAFSHASDTSGAAPHGLRLAVGRSNGDIEIWNPRHNWTHETTLPGARGRTVEGLVWAHAAGELPRLFSIGSSTYITEWDLKTGRPRANLNCNAGVIWCIDTSASGDRLAVGCDDGSVVLIDISGGSGVMEFSSICQRQEQRVLGLSWYGDDMVIGGCADGRVRCWATKGDSKGRIVGSMKVDKLQTESTLVWSVAALPTRGQFVTGDSTGSVKFWDIETFSLMQNFTVHEADVLALVKDATGEKIFSAGIDRKIHQYSWLDHKSKKKSKWIHNYNRLLHLNDVRSLSLFESKAHNFLVSGGVERSIIVQSVESFHQGPYKKIILDQQQSNITACPSSNLIALFQDQTVKVWRLADDRHKLVAKLTLADEDNITSVTIGESGESASFMAVSTLNSVKVFQLTEENQKLKVQKIRDSNFDSIVSGARRVLIYDENRLLIQTPEDEIYKFSISNESIDLEDEVECVAKEGNAIKAGFEYFNSIHSICIAKDSTSIIVARYNNSIEVLPLNGEEGYLLTTLSIPVHLLTTTEDDTVVVLTEENKVFELNIAKDSANLLTAWSQKNSENLPTAFLKTDDKPQGMFTQNKRLWVYGGQWLAFFDLSANVEFSKHIQKQAKKRTRDGLSILATEEHNGKLEEDGTLDEEITRATEKREQENDDEKEFTANGKSKNNYWMTQKYRPILKVLDWSENEIAVVEREAFALPTTAAFEAARFRI